MPANLGPDYLAAEQEYRRAETTAEKIAALEAMYSALPKHKGTEKMQAELKRRLAQARKSAPKKGAAHSQPFYLIHKEGAGQVALIGPPNSGKSSIVATLTHAQPEVADFPFTTHFPTPGMMMFEDVPIQLVDLPPIAAEFTEPWMGQAVRHATLSVLVVDANDPADLEEIEVIEQSLAGWKAPPPALLVAAKIDLPGARGNFVALEELYRDRYRCLALSTTTGEGLPEFGRALYEALRVVRVYTKRPGHPAELDRPYLLPQGATVLDAARHVHKDFAEQLKYARRFHREGGRDGLMVDRNHAIEDRDILEFHI